MAAPTSRTSDYRKDPTILSGGYDYHQVRPLNFAKGRKNANSFVEGLQDPFKARVAAIVDPLGKLRDANTLTYQQVLDAQTAFEKEVTDFQTAAGEFAAQGGASLTVYNQANTKLDPIIENWRKTFKDDIARLGPPEESTTPGKPPGPDPNREQKAQGAAEQQRKRAQAGNGRRGTILGGSGRIAGYGLQGPTILGY